MVEARVDVRSRKQDVPTYYVHGAWGGIGPAGEIIVYLYQDTLEFPEEFTLRAAAGKGPLREGTPHRPRVERMVLARLVMQGPVASALARWLSEKAAALEALHTAQLTSDKKPQ